METGNESFTSPERSSRQVIGLPVIDAGSGTNVGRVKDLVVDGAARSVVGLSLVTGVFPKGAETHVPFSAVLGFGQDAVTVRQGPRDPSRGEGGPRIRESGRFPGVSSTPLRDKAVITELGDKLGEVEDYRFNVESGAITVFLLAGDGSRRKQATLRMLPADKVSVIGKDVLIAEAGSDALMEEVSGQPGAEEKSLPGRLADGVVRSAGAVRQEATRVLEDSWDETVSRAQEVSRALAEQLRKTRSVRMEATKSRLDGTVRLIERRSGQLREKWSEWQDRLRELRRDPAGALREGDIAALTGKRADMAVHDDAGTVIVERGETITSRHVESARKAGKLYSLFLTAASGDVRERMMEVEQAREQLETATERDESPADGAEPGSAGT